MTKNLDCSRRNTMSSTSDKAKGLANEAVGNVKQGVGKVTGNDKLRRRRGSGKERRSAESGGRYQRRGKKSHQVSLNRWLYACSPTAIHGWPFLCQMLQLKSGNCFKVAK